MVGCGMVAGAVAGEAGAMAVCVGQNDSHRRHLRLGDCWKVRGYVGHEVLFLWCQQRSDAVSGMATVGPAAILHGM
jgi:hypothetical protein